MQQHLHGEILILPSENFRPEADFSNVDNYGAKTAQVDDDGTVDDDGAAGDDGTADRNAEPTGNSS